MRTYLLTNRLIQTNDMRQVYCQRHLKTDITVASTTFTAHFSTENLHDSSIQNQVNQLSKLLDSNTKLSSIFFTPITP